MVAQECYCEISKFSHSFKKNLFHLRGHIHTPIHCHKKRPFGRFTSKTPTDIKKRPLVAVYIL